MNYPLMFLTDKNTILIALSIEQADILFKLVDKELYEIDSFLWEDFNFTMEQDDLFRQSFSQQLHSIRFNEDYTEVNLSITVYQAFILLILFEYNIESLKYQGEDLFTEDDNDILGRPMAVNLHKFLKFYKFLEE